MNIEVITQVTGSGKEVVETFEGVSGQTVEDGHLLVKHRVGTSTLNLAIFAPKTWLYSRKVSKES